MTHGDLFSGIGGFSLAARWCGIKTLWSVEIDGFCTKVYRKHFPEVEVHGDVKKVKALQYVDIITAGFPCQPVSVAGRRKGDKDERWLWPDIVRLLREIRPRWLLVENVPGLLSVEAGRLFGGVLRDLAESGYNAEWDCIPASAVGAPHIRDRVWLVAYPAERPGQQGVARAAKRKVQGKNGGEAPRIFGRPVAHSDCPGWWTREGSCEQSVRPAEGGENVADSPGRKSGEQAEPEGREGAGRGGQEVSHADERHGHVGGHGAGAVLGKGPEEAHLWGCEADVQDPAGEGRGPEGFADAGEAAGGEALGRAAGPGEGVADAEVEPERTGLRASESAGIGRGRSGDSGSAAGGVADAEGEEHRLLGPGVRGEEGDDVRLVGWWSAEPDVGRVAHGVPSRLDRLKSLGNAIVPQVAAVILRRIVEYDNR